MKIDAHQHLWSTHRPNDYGFLTPAAGVLYNDYYPGDLRPILEANGIDYTVLVQAAETEEETQWLLDIAKDVDFIAGVVGWIDFDTDPKTFIQRLEFFRKDPKFIGLRPMLQDLSDDRFILRPQVLENLRTVASLDFPFDILIFPKHLPHVCETLQKVPGLRAVIDHMAKPEIRNQKIDSWFNWIEKVSQFPNVWCKLSGMVTEADHKNWKPGDFVPYVDGIVKCFGSERLMFGSDWPVCLQAATYKETCNLLKNVLDTLPKKLNVVEQEGVFGRNAERFYKLIINQNRRKFS